MKEKLVEVAKDFKGDYGLYVRNLNTGVKVEINADKVFPTARMIKVPILCSLFDRINRGESIRTWLGTNDTTRDGRAACLHPARKGGEQRGE